MRTAKENLLRSCVAILLCSVLLGLLYPLAVTGLAQLAFPNQANGSRVELGGRVVGSALIGQDFGGDRGYFQSRPSATEYSADVTYFNNLGPNSRQLSRFFGRQLATYLKRERPYDRGLSAAAVPVDAVTTSGSGVDPLISEANARIQAHRVAAVRGLPLARVLALVAANTDDRDLGLLGEPGVNVLRLNVALDQAAPR